MLVLSRKPGESIQIGAGITVTLVEVKGNRIRLGIDAPPDVAIVRSELNEFRDPATPPNAESAHYASRHDAGPESFFPG